MIDSGISIFSNVLIGGIAANLLLIMSLISVAAGGQGSYISPERRLPKDSDGNLFVILFIAGGLCGLAVAFVTSFVPNWTALIPTGVIGFFAGLLLAFPRVQKLNTQYLARAEKNLEEGLFKEALEDASEVARSSERLRSRANEIMDIASEKRRNQPIGDLTSSSFSDASELEFATSQEDA